MKKNDYILIGAILIIGIIVIIVINITKTEGSKVLITVEGVELKTLDLNKNTTYTIDGKNGKKNILEIKDGYVTMKDATCPDKLCVHHKSIHYNRETIVCLPNKVVFEIVDGEDNQIDAIAQ